MIQIKDVSFSYDSNEEALKHLNLEIKKGSWVSILGHNGSGKSTLAKLLVGLLDANQGEIYIDDLLMNTENLQEIRKRIGIVFQNPDNQFVGVTVKHDVAFGLENKCLSVDVMNEKIDKYLDYVNMKNYKDKEPHQLSGGQKQRVAIAGLLAMEQDIIILDEATSMLDPEGTKDIIDLIKKLNKEQNKTVITITHDLTFAGLSDTLIVLREGECILQGTPEEVFEQETLLQSSRLELPMGVKLYHDIKKKGKMSERLKEALWAFNSNM